MIKIITFGVFDLFHIGHLNFLRNASNIHSDNPRFKMIDHLNRRLVVGVCDDKLNNQLKTPAVCTDEERAYIVSNIACVSECFIYNTTDYETYVRDCNVFAYGPEWGKDRPDQQRFLDWCKEHSIETYLIPRTEGISTSELIKKIKEF